MWTWHAYGRWTSMNLSFSVIVQRRADMIHGDYFLTEYSYCPYATAWASLRDSDLLGSLLRGRLGERYCKDAVIHIGLHFITLYTYFVNTEEKPETNIPLP